MRIVLAFLFAPLIPALAATALNWVLPSSVTVGKLGWYLFIATMSPLVAVPATLLIAIPLFLWIRRSGRVDLIRVFAIGAFAGGVSTAVAVPYLAGGVSSITLHDTLVVGATFVASGLLIAGLFWFIAFGTRKAP